MTPPPRLKPAAPPPTGEESAAIFRLGCAFLAQFFDPALSVSIVRDLKALFR